MDKYLIKYLRDNEGDSLRKKYIDFFKIELDWHIYNGDIHISKPYYKNAERKNKVKIFEFFQFYNALYGNDKVNPDNLNVLSTVFFPNEAKIEAMGFNLISPVWQPMGRKNVFGDSKTIKWHKDIRNRIKTANFHSFLNPEFHAGLEDFQQHLINEYRKKDLRALLLNTDQYFYSKYFIDVFKKLEKPSIVFSHGLPGVYSPDVDNRSDFLMVWSEKIRQNYINAGFDPSKIKVTGNPKYNTIAKNKELRSDLSDILVVPSSIVWHQDEYDTTVVSDKSSVILYLYKVQNVLQSMGVKKSRYRVHPSINKQWVHTFLDQDFYIQDNESLQDSLGHTSLVIGSTSTLLLDALIAGVNYIVFEPVENNINMMGCKSVPPFDGSEPKVMFCNTEAELEKMLKHNALTDYTLVHDYMQEFDLRILKDIIH